MRSWYCTKATMKCFVFSHKRTFSSSTKAVIQLSKEDSMKPILQHFGNVKMFTQKELKEATQGFRSSNKIGEGGFGSVYKGRLQDGSLVAVKMLSYESKQGDREFIAEMRSMWSVRHENLVKLVGVCIDGNNRILVYEYMENNSLAQIMSGGKQNKAKLGWEARREICLGIAKGLAYLHEEIKLHIVHRDIKASNILLDHNFRPRVSDFGLSKLFPENITHLSTRVAGTLGYLAPEYGISGHLTRKSDVYSFGVLVLEILSGRGAVDFSLELGKYCLVEKAWEMYKTGDLLNLLDHTLQGEFPETEAILFLKVGLLCVQETPSLRPKMYTAVKMMCSEIHINNVEITHPALITDLMKLKMANRQSAQSPFSKFTSSGNTTQSPMSRFSKHIKMQSSHS